jgi:PKD repeat protein
VNASGGFITAFTVSYTGEQWRVGGMPSVNNTLVMQFSLNGANWSVMGAAFDFNTPVDSDNSGALDGNDPANRVIGIGDTFTLPAPLANGGVFYLRWADADNTQQDHGIAVDDLMITFAISNLPPVANFSGDPTIGLAPLTVNFTSLSSNATGFSWDFGDGNTSTDEHPSNTYSNAGTYSVTLAATGPGGTNALTQVNYITVTNAPPPPVVANFTADVTGGLGPLTVNFTNLSANATGFTWDFGDGNGGADEHPSNTYSNAGVYSVTLTATGPGGTNALTQTNYITVTNAPPPPVVANFAADVTSGLTPLAVNFTSLSSNATGFSWDFGDGNFSTDEHPSNTYSNAGVYSVTLTATGPGGTNALTQTNYITVTNLPPPLLVISPGALDFGSILTGAVAQASFVVSNSGGTTLNGTAAVSLAPFALLDGTSNSVGNLAYAIPAAASTNLAVTFAPSGEGSFSNVVIFLTDGGNSTNAIAGLGFGTPVIIDLASSATEFLFSFLTVPGKSYDVQFKDSLDDPLWQTLQTVPGDGTLKTITNLTAAPAQRFYRLRVQ